jgi:hypothetical protein
MREVVVKQLGNESENEEQVERENKIRAHRGKIFGQLA